LTSNSKGGASIEILIFMTLIIVFMILPIMSFAIEKIIVNICIERVVDTMESALYDTVESVELSKLAEGSIEFNTEEIEKSFYKKMDTRISNVLELDQVDLDFYPASNGSLPCSPSKKLEFDTLHVYISGKYELFLYRDLILPGEDKVINFHFDLEVPKNN